MAILRFVLPFLMEEYMKTIFDYQREIISELKENEYLKVLYNWGEIYRYIKEIEK